MARNGSLAGARLEIFDDSSTEFGLGELRAAYGAAAVRVRTSIDPAGRTMLGPDRNIWGIYSTFVRCPVQVCGRHLLVLDADALLAPTWRAELFDPGAGPLAAALKKHGIVTLYNSGSPQHPTVEYVLVVDRMPGV